MRCKACDHPNVVTINQQIVAGATLRPLVASTGISMGVLSRHRGHIKDLLKESIAREQSEREGSGNDLLQRVRRLADEAEELLQAAKAAKNLKAATSAICAAVRVLELTGRLDGSLAQPNAPGLHLTLNQRVTNVSIISYENDVEFAVMVGEATRGFDVNELMRLKALVDNSSVQQPHNGHVIALNPKP
jgi:hypothetical protein